MPHFIISDTLPRLAVESVGRMCPLVGEAACHISPVCDIQVLTNRDDTMADTCRPELVMRLPRQVAFLHSNTRVNRIPVQQHRHHTTSAPSAEIKVQKNVFCARFCCFKTFSCIFFVLFGGIYYQYSTRVLTV